MPNRVCARCGAQAQAGLGTCRQCGWPLGAKAPSAGSGSGSKALLIVLGCIGGLAVLGIVAAIFIPNFLDALQKGRQKRTLADLTALSKALEEYASDAVARGNLGTYPDAASVEDLELFLVPEFINTVQQTDGWDRQIRYLCVRDPGRTEGCESFLLVSAGSDGEFAYESDQSVLFREERFSATDYSHDLIVGPEGVVQGPSGLSGRRMD